MRIALYVMVVHFMTRIQTSGTTLRNAWVLQRLGTCAIFSSVDCQPWRIAWDPATGCIGGGEGTIVKSGDYYYHLIEAADRELGCEVAIGAQNWVLGLLRSPTLAFPSGTWQQIGSNPAVVPWQKRGCALQYHRLFYDDSQSTYYMSVFVIDYSTNQMAMKIFKWQFGAGTFPMIINL